MDTDPLNNRWTTREPAHLDVTIRNKEVELLNCIAEDVSWSGAFIKTNSTDTLHPNDPVELLFYIKEKHEVIEYKIDAKVVRCLAEGYGFEFTKFNIPTFLKLRKIRKNRDQHTSDQ